MQPSDLNLPPKFTRYRTGQLDAIANIVGSPTRFVLYPAPTGSGKSAVYISAHSMIGGRTLVLTPTRALQQQLLADFASIGLVDMRGRNNYTCTSYTNCQQGLGRPSPVDPTKRINACPDIAEPAACPYLAQLHTAQASSLVVTNYAYWLAINKSNPTALGQFDLLVCDEAHAAPWLVTNSIAVEVPVSATQQYDPPAPRSSIQAGDWVAWARKLLKRHNPIPRAHRDALKQLANLALSTNTPWIPQPPTKYNRHTLTLTPLWANALAEPLLFRSIPRVLLTSATLTPLTAKFLGIDSADLTTYEQPSTFDPRRRPFYYMPTARIDSKLTPPQFSQWINRCDTFIAQRLDRKGIWHTRSYARARAIMAQSRHGKKSSTPILISHEPGDLQRALSQYRRTPPPVVLVSPSVEQGFDFYGDQCRYQIISKIPFLDRRDPLTDARVRSDDDYGLLMTAESIVQTAGRPMRSADDWGETIIFDDHWKWWQRKAPLPSYFRAACKWVDRLPPPLDLED